MSIDRFMELFQGRSDVFAQQLESGAYRPVRRPITRQDYIDHGNGRYTYGIYTVREDNATRFIVWDIDTMDSEPVRRITDELDERGLEYLVEFSGKKGHHVWLLFDHWAPADYAYKAGRFITKKAGVNCEVFPKQPHLNHLELGNLVKLPLGKHQVSGEWSAFVLEDGWVDSMWATLNPINSLQLMKLVDEYDQLNPPREPRPFPVRITGKPSGLPPCMQRVLENGVTEGKRDVALFSLAVECKRQGKDEDEAYELLREANDKNDPPMLEWEVRNKVRSAYSKPYQGIKCEMEWLHERENPLCSRACPRYSGAFGAATAESKDVSAKHGNNELNSGLEHALKSGDPIQLTVESSFVRGDGRTVYVLSHPDFTNNPVGVI